MKTVVMVRAVTGDFTYSHNKKLSNTSVDLCHGSHLQETPHLVYACLSCTYAL